MFLNQTQKVEVEEIAFLTLPPPSISKCIKGKYMIACWAIKN